MERFWGLRGEFCVGWVLDAQVDFSWFVGVSEEVLLLCSPVDEVRVVDFVGDVGVVGDAVFECRRELGDKFGVFLDGGDVDFRVRAQCGESVDCCGGEDARSCSGVEK